MDEWSFHFSFFHLSSVYFHPLYNFNFSFNQIFILYIMPPSSIIIQLFVQPYKIFHAFHIFCLFVEILNFQNEMQLPQGIHEH